jgi:dephospho-CoA kinase
VRIGLTGPIGCGKSTIAAWLRDAGGVTVDADAIAREVTAPGEPTLPLIRQRFGDRVFDSSGRLDRAALARIVFDDRDALADLERIVHPRVRERIATAVADAEARGAPFVAIEAIKLVEGGYADQCDVVWLVECSPETQRERLSGRGMASEDVERRLAAQGGDLAERLSAAATRRIDTDGPSEQTRSRVEAALRAAVFGPRAMGEGA